MHKRKTIFQTLQLEWAVSCSSWPHLCLNWHPHVCAIAQRHHYGLWICYQHLGTPFMMTGLSSPDKYSKFRPFAAPRWTFTEGPRITLAPLPCVWHGFQRRFESLNHCSQPKFGPWNSGFLQIDSTLNSVPMAAATNPIRSSSHVEAKPSMPVVSKKHAKRREKTKTRPTFWASNMGRL